MDPTYDAETHARSLYRENLWLRELAIAVARDLEQLATGGAEAVADRQRLLSRAMRIRNRLHEGVAPSWRPAR